jgi:hypothetical protein
LALLLAGCSQAVAITPPTPDTAAALACAALAAALPSTVAGQDRRDTTPDSGLTAAWGDPPIVLRCGVARPVGLTQTAQVTAINGVDWYPQERTAGYVFTTSGRVAYIEVAVPSTYGSQAGGLPALGAAISATVPRSTTGTP